MAVLTIQPSNIDTYLAQGSPTSNTGSEAEFNLSKVSGNELRGLLRFDFSSLPDGVTISDAKLGLYYEGATGDPVGETVYACEVTQPAWVELEATWNVYSTGNNWAVAGGD